jgi:hypothetical protein
MKKTLQDQYLLIKEGKGHKGVFLTEAKRQFPDIVRNAATFEEASASLITKNIITENVIGLTTVAGYEPRKKESYETAFEAFLAEAKKKENEDEKVKAEEKKVSKKVEEDASHNFDNTDEKNPDNMIFGQIMMGYYAEMKDPKNSEKTMQELKDIVFKNLSKDPIYYTKNAQFGVKGLGYTDEAPALGMPKEAKGKYKGSGYGDLNESIQPLNEEDKLRRAIREMIDAELEEAYQMPSISTANVSGGGGGRRFIPNQLPFPVNIRKRFGDHMVYNPISNTFYISDILYNNLVKGYANQPAIKKLIMDIPPMVKQILNKPDNYGPIVNLPKEFKVYHPVNAEVEKAKADKFNKAGDKQYWSEGDFLFPNLNIMEEEMAESLMESVEKDLAQINKEAEHEVLQSKMEKIQSLIDKKQSQLSKLDEDEDMKHLTDDKKVKEISKNIKSLEKAKAKLEKIMGKVKGKGSKKEVIDEMDNAEDAVADIAPDYIEDANQRLRAGEKIDSIISNYQNLSFQDRNHLKNYLEWQKGSDVGQDDELDAYEPY